MSKERTKVLPDKILCDLWKKAAECELQEYIKIHTSVISDDYIDFKHKYGIQIDQSIEMLKGIYKCSNMSLKEIMSEIGMGKSKLSYIYCIPIRTVEDWYAEIHRTPDYIRLQLVKDYNILNLGKFIKLQSEIDKEKTIKPVYKKNESQNNKKTEPKIKTSELDTILKEYEHKKVTNPDGVKKSVEVRELLEKTDYLKDILNKR